VTDAPPVSSQAPPLSVAQEALWYLSLLAPKRVSYNETISIRKDGPLDIVAFRRAFDEIVRRHEAWRTTFDTERGEAVQVVHPAPSFELPIIDLSALTGEQAERRAVRIVAEVSRVPYDLRRGPLLRPRLFRFPGDHHRLYLAMHHLIFDGVSVYRVVLPELAALYDAFSAGRPSPLPEPAIQYADYAIWEQNWITQPRVARRLAHWSEHLRTLPALTLPLDHPRPQDPSFRGGVLPISLPRETVDRLRDLGQGAGATLFQVFAAVWSLLLSRYCGEQLVVFATAADLRQRQEFEGLVGYCLTPVVLRVDLAGDPSFAELVVRVRNELLDALDHLVPFERLVRELQPSRTSTVNPIYQSMLVLEPKMATPDSFWTIHQMESAVGDAVGSAKLDLELELDERPDGHIDGRLIYDRDLFEAATARRMAQHWMALAATVASDPSATVSRIPILSADEEQRQLVEWNATATSGGAAAVQDILAAQCEKRPDATAVSAAGEAASYADIDRRASAIAGRLLAAGVKPGDVVGICAEPSLELISGALGVLKSGAAYVLLDPTLPVERLEFMVGDCAAAAVLAAPGLAAPAGSSQMRVIALAQADDDQPTAIALPDVAGDAVCCLAYAASPTEESVAVPMLHAAVVNLATALAADLGLGPADTVLLLPATLFDAPVFELWTALLAGARIVIAPPDAALDGAALSRLIAGERVTFLHASPSAWQRLIDTGLKGARALRALSGGGRLSPELALQILERCRVLWNAYGTPRTTGYCTLGRVEAGAPVTIGRAIANMRAYVVDVHDRPVPVGVTGELLIAGSALAGGDHERDDPAAPVFTEDPFGPGRVHRTGERARWMANGDIQLVGAATPPAL
jgi:non-ribosomal peptide synthetase component F